MKRRRRQQIKTRLMLIRRLKRRTLHTIIRSLREASLMRARPGGNPMR